MQQSNQLLNFLIECFKRLTAKSPTFFKVWKVITGIPVLIIALPDALKILNIHLPQIFNDNITTAVSWASSAAFIMAFFPTQSAPIAVDQNGTPVKQTDTSKLPFTAVSEQKVVDKEKSKDEVVVSQVAIPNPVKPV